MDMIPAAESINQNYVKYKAKETAFSMMVNTNEIFRDFS